MVNFKMVDQSTSQPPHTICLHLGLTSNVSELQVHHYVNYNIIVLL